MRPREAVWTGEVEPLGRVGDGNGVGMTGSAVSWDVDAEMDGAGEREVSVGCEREGSNVRSREFRVGVARFALSSTRGFQIGRAHV